MLSTSGSVSETPESSSICYWILRGFFQPRRFSTAPTIDERQQLTSAVAPTPPRKAYGYEVHLPPWEHEPGREGWLARPCGAFVFGQPRAAKHIKTRYVRDRAFFSVLALKRIANFQEQCGFAGVLKDLPRNPPTPPGPKTGSIDGIQGRGG